MQTKTEMNEIVRVRALVRGCSLGQVLLAVTSRGICFLALGDDSDSLFAELRARLPRVEVDPADAGLQATADEVVQMIDDKRAVARDLALDLRGTDFQRRVWRALQEIPAGTTSTYADVARTIGAPRAIRAVGTACGRNPVAIAVPCHRVLRGDGSLGGYRWGLERKQALLQRERAQAS